MKIFIIGSGNVATQLGMAFKKSGHEIVGVYSRNILHAKRLGKKLRTDFTDDLKNSSLHTIDIYLVAVKDDAINEVIKKIPFLKNELVVHTSGATDIKILRKNFKNCGVLWQVQTIQARSKAEFKNIPFVIEASNESSKRKLILLAKTLTRKIYIFNSRQRRILHLAAVWINNFPNHLFYLGEKILKKNNLPYELFHPLILSTALNGMKNPYLSQTGPAKRNDKNTLFNHLQLLSFNKEYQEIYSILSESIRKNHV